MITPRFLSSAVIPDLSPACVLSHGRAAAEKLFAATTFAKIISAFRSAVTRPCVPGSRMLQESSV